MKFVLLLLFLCSSTSFALDLIKETINSPILENKRTLKKVQYDYSKHGKVWVHEGQCQSIANGHQIYDSQGVVLVPNYTEEACLELNPEVEASQSELIDPTGYRQGLCRDNADRVLLDYKVSLDWSPEKQINLVLQLSRLSERLYRRCSRKIRKQHKLQQVWNQVAILKDKLEQNPDQHSLYNQKINNRYSKISNLEDAINSIDASVSEIEEKIDLFKSKMSKTRSCEHSSTSETVTILSGQSYTFGAFEEYQVATCTPILVTTQCVDGKLSYDRDDFSDSCNPKRVCDSEDCKDAFAMGPLSVGQRSRTGLQGWKRIDIPEQKLTYFLDPSNTSDDPKDHSAGIIVHDHAYSLYVGQGSLDQGKSLVDVKIEVHDSLIFPQDIYDSDGVRVNFDDYDNVVGNNYSVTIQGQEMPNIPFIETILITDTSLMNLSNSDLDELEYFAIDFNNGTIVNGQDRSVILNLPLTNSSFTLNDSFMTLGSEFGAAESELILQRVKGRLESRSKPDSLGNSVGRSIRGFIRKRGREHHCGTWVCTLHVDLQSKRICTSGWEGECEVWKSALLFGGYHFEDRCYYTGGGELKVTPRRVAEINAAKKLKKFMHEKLTAAEKPYEDYYEHQIEGNLECYRSEVSGEKAPKSSLFLLEGNDLSDDDVEKAKSERDAYDASVLPPAIIRKRTAAGGGGTKG